MKKLWILCILFLTTVSTATEFPHKEVYEKPPTKEQFYPLYDSGLVIDSTIVYLFDGNVKFTGEMYYFLTVMLDSAMQDSVEIKINSAYRTFEEQLECRVKNIRRKNKQYDSLFLLTAESKNFRPITAKPGYSSHQRGIAFDFNCSDKEVYKWLKENAINYGFVRTVKQEKWHWEYRPEVKDIYEFVKEKHWSWRIKT